MTLSIEDVRKVARLARLKLTDEEQHRLVDELGKILGYIDQLSELDTADIEPMAHTEAVTNVFRLDELKPSLDRSDALANAPKSDKKYFLVPPIIDAE